MRGSIFFLFFLTKALHQGSFLWGFLRYFIIPQDGCFRNYPGKKSCQFSFLQKRLFAGTVTKSFKKNRVSIVCYIKLWARALKHKQEESQSNGFPKNGKKFLRALNRLIPRSM